jgi:hypothetical protein
LQFKVLGLGPKVNSEYLNEPNHLDEEKGWGYKNSDKITDLGECERDAHVSLLHRVLIFLLNDTLPTWYLEMKEGQHNCGFRFRAKSE